MLQVERFFRQSRTLLRQNRTLLQHCCRFWQQCRTTFRPFDSTKWKQIEHVQFVSTLSKKNFWNFTKNLIDIVAINGNNVEGCFEIVAVYDFVGKTKFYDKLVRHCCWCGRGLTPNLEELSTVLLDCIMDRELAGSSRRRALITRYNRCPPPTSSSPHSLMYTGWAKKPLMVLITMNDYAIKEWFYGYIKIIMNYSM